MTTKQDEKLNSRIGVLDGVRVLAIFIVVTYHFWQQTWIAPIVSVNLPFLESLGIYSISFDSLIRYGYDLVDALILLSAVCNFIPYGKAIVLGTEWLSAKKFYIRRAIRILPSYYLAVIIALFTNLINHSYFSKGFMIKDILCRLSMTSIFFKDTMNDSLLNGVLWTVQVEVWFYLLIPLIALGYKKIPVITSIILFAISGGSIFAITQYTQAGERYYNDFILTFSFLYALGMIIVIVYFYFHKNLQENIYTKLVGTFLLLGSIFAYGRLLKHYGIEDATKIQLLDRIPRGLIFTVFILGLMFAFRFVKVIFDNKVIFVLSTITYNMYIWHQFLAVKLKYDMRIPFWEGDVPPNITGDRVWMWKYAIIITVVSIVVAIATTYLIEKPIAKRLKNKIKL